MPFHITLAFSTGEYIPLTAEGTIIVDRVLASCHAGCYHDLAHLSTTPLQRFSEVMEWIFGNDFGLPVYVGTARQLGEFILPDGDYWDY